MLDSHSQAGRYAGYCCRVILGALLLPRGTTAHKRFKIPIQINADSVCGINRGTEFAEDILQATLITWDEAPMMSRYVFKAVDRTLRDLTQQPDLPFGGKTVVLGGDFRQCLPVVPRAQPEELSTRPSTTLISGLRSQFCGYMKTCESDTIKSGEMLKRPLNCRR